MKSQVSTILTVTMVLMHLLLSSSLAQKRLTDNALDKSLQKDVALPDILSIAYQKNPSIKLKRNAWRMVIETFKVKTSYPDPQLMFTYFPDPIETRLGPQEWNASFSQLIPFPGKLSTAGKVIKADVKIAKLNLDKTVRDVMTSVQESFFELIYIRKAQTTIKRHIELIDQLRKETETAYAQDRSTFMDIAKAQSQVAQLRYDLFLLDELEATEITRLNGLLNRPPEAKLGNIIIPKPFQVAYTLESLYKLAEKNQEEIKMTRAKSERASSKVKLEKYNYLPNFKLGLFYAGIGQPDGTMAAQDAGRDALGIQFGMTLPIWFGKNRSSVAKAKAFKQTAESENIQKINMAQTKIHKTYFKLQNARRIIDLYEKSLVPQALKSLEIAETWYQQGQGSFSDFIEAQATLYNFELAIYRANSDYFKYVVRLEALVGESLRTKELKKGENKK